MRAPHRPGPSRLPSASGQLEPRYNFVDNVFDPTPRDDQAGHYPLLTARELARYREPPKRFRALVRDFISDALYNPHYGYFPTQADILDVDIDPDADAVPSATRKPNATSGVGGFAFNQIRDSFAFDLEVAKRYGALRVDVSIPGRGEGRARQVWHTPTELFKVRPDRTSES